MNPSAPARRRRRSLARLLLVALFLTGAALGCGGPERTTTGGNEYVALGDSYTSGPGIDPVADTGCRRSEVNYPSLVAKALKISKFVDRSCGGANTSHLTKPENFGFGRLNDPQIEAIDKQTRLVTIGLGLNDQAISRGLLLVCQNPDGGELPEQCRTWLDTPVLMVEDRIKAAAAHIQAGIESIHERAPKAQVVLVGYPRLVPDSGDCPDRLPVPDAQVERMRVLMRFTNQVWSETARVSDAEFVDVYAASEGHDICSDTPWISGFGRSLSGGPQMHPYATYHKAVAALVVDTVDR